MLLLRALAEYPSLNRMQGPKYFLGGHGALAIGEVPAAYAVKPSGLTILQTCRRTPGLSRA